MGLISSGLFSLIIVEGGKRGWGRGLRPQSEVCSQRHRGAAEAERCARPTPWPPARRSRDLRLDATGRRRPAPPGRQDVRLLPHGAAHLARSPRQRCASSPPAARSPRGGWAPRGARAGRVLGRAVRVGCGAGRGGGASGTGPRSRARFCASGAARVCASLLLRLASYLSLSLGLLPLSIPAAHFVSLGR